MKKPPHLFVSLIPLVVLVIMLFATIRTFGSDALSGGSQVSLLTTTAVCILIGMGFYKIGWKDFELAITNNITGVSTALIILLIIGALSGAWMISGVVPYIDLLRSAKSYIPVFPDLYLHYLCLGIGYDRKPWTTIATIGIALMGIGKAQGFEEGWIAGAIISGAYFGDKISIIGYDNISSPSYRYSLFRHIRYMLITTVPSLIITLVIFTVAGLSPQCRKHRTYSRILGRTGRKVPHYTMAADCTGSYRCTDCSAGTFRHHLISVGGLAGAFAVFFQPDLLQEISGLQNSEGTQSIFKGLMMTLYGGTSLQTSNEALTELVATRVWQA